MRSISLIFFHSSAIRADAVDGNFIMLRLEAFRQRDAGLRLRGQIHVKNRVAGIAVKMAVLVHVRAKARCAAIQRDLPGQPALYQRVEAVVNRGHGNIRHGLFGPDEDLLGGRVIALLQQHVVNVLALRRGPESARRQAFIQVSAHRFLLDQAHATGTLDPPPASVNT